MVSWIALVLAFFAWCSASVALGVAVWVYLKGPKIKELDIDDLFDALLEENDTNMFFRQEPNDD
jgi:hypothetical protein